MASAVLIVIAGFVAYRSTATQPWEQIKEGMHESEVERLLDSGRLSARVVSADSDNEWVAQRWDMGACLVTVIYDPGNIVSSVTITDIQEPMFAKFLRWIGMKQ